MSSHNASIWSHAAEADRASIELKCEIDKTYIGAFARYFFDLFNHKYCVFFPLIRIFTDGFRNLIPIASRRHHQRVNNYIY